MYYSGINSESGICPPRTASGGYCVLSRRELRPRRLDRHHDLTTAVASSGRSERRAPSAAARSFRQSSGAIPVLLTGDAGAATSFAMNRRKRLRRLSQSVAWYLVRSYHVQYKCQSASVPAGIPSGGLCVFVSGLLAAVALALLSDAARQGPAPHHRPPALAPPNSRSRNGGDPIPIGAKYPCHTTSDEIA